MQQNCQRLVSVMAIVEKIRKPVWVGAKSAPKTKRARRNTDIRLSQRLTFLIHVTNTCISDRAWPEGNIECSSETSYFGVLSGGRFARARLDCMNLRTATSIFGL